MADSLTSSSPDSLQNISGGEMEKMFDGDDGDAIIEEDLEEELENMNSMEERKSIDIEPPKKLNHHQLAVYPPTNSKCFLYKIPHVGLLMAVTSSLFFSICSLIVRLLTSVSPLEHSTIRFIGVFLPSVCLVIYYGKNPLGEKGSRFILLMRGILGSTGLIFHFYAFQHMPLADASVIVFSAPVFVTIFARIFLKEYCSPAHIVSIVITLIGVVLISRPPFLFHVNDSSYSAPNLLGSLYALAGTVCSANVYVLIRKLKSLHYAVIMATFATIGITMSQTTSLIVGKTCIPCPFEERVYLLILGLFSFLGQVLLTKSLQLEQAGPVSICRTADIVFAFVWQVIFLGEVPNVSSVIGAFLVTSSVLVMGVRKWVLETPMNSPWRKKLWLLT
ncbi:hypothetical protein CHUAL_012919 [Chamberlinius hualienensis]